LRWMTKLIARLLATAAFWVRFQTHFKKYKLGGISKGMVNTLKLAKKIYKNKRMLLK
jgi:hypothetical protein